MAPRKLRADPLHGFRRRAASAVGDPTVGRELLPDALDRVERNAQVHHAADVAQRQLEADQHHDFVRRHDLHQLRIAFHALDRQLQLEHVFPGVLHLLARTASVIRDTSRSSISVSGRRASGAGSLPPPSKPIDDRKQDRQVDVEDQVAFQRLGLEQIEAGRVFQAEDELAVGELIDAGELHLDDAAQQAGKGRAEIAAEPLVQRLQRPHLLLADALGPLEVVGRDLSRDGLMRLVGARRRPRRSGDIARRSIALSRLSTSAWLRTSSLMLHSVREGQSSGSQNATRLAFR